jgi:hypothetical protein
LIPIVLFHRNIWKWITLKESYVDCFGGPDRALDSFSDIQKAINFAMTLTTGGIRGGSEKIGKFQQEVLIWDCPGSVRRF